MPEDVSLSGIGRANASQLRVINTHEHFDHIGANKYFFDTVFAKGTLSLIGPSGSAGDHVSSAGERRATLNT